VTGRPPLLRLYNYDVPLPVQFSLTSNPRGDSIDAQACDNFYQLILAAAMSEKCQEACTQPPTFSNSAFLNKLTGQSTRAPDQDYQDLINANAVYDNWLE
jgi:hypothetical protein